MLRDDCIENPIVIIQGGQRDYYYRFQQLQDIVVAHSPDNILQTLQQIESAVTQNGFFAAGFISYEAAPAFDAALRVHHNAGDSFPLLWFGLFKKREAVPIREVVQPDSTSAYHLTNWRPSISQAQYEGAIRHIHGRIAAGDTYQVNYTLRMRAAFEGQPRAFFADLVKAQRPNYAAYIETADFAVCSASPELFFTLDGRTLTSRPMKGTAPRALTQPADREQAAWLQQSEKNRAENVMIVDMIRNDIGRIADTGSVRVPELFTVERYPTLWQMTSTVTGQTDASVTEILTALFPCASITGAPKVSTMQIIAGLETAPRQLYTGAVGWIAPERQVHFNVAIRTAVIDRQTGGAVYGVGGGIVWDSTTGNEFNECQVKARILTERRPSFQLLETMIWTPEAGIFLLEEHLNRLADSADYFGYPLNRSEIEKQLADRVQTLSKRRYKIRLLLDNQGQVVFETIPLPSAKKEGLIRIDIAAKPIDSANVFLYHKTTHRDLYTQARELRPNCDDVLLWNERGEITESTIANVVLNLDGRWVTPPIESGLLGGTFRQHLLAAGEIEEQVIMVEELARADEIYLINSVQGWRQVELVDQISLHPKPITVNC